MDTRRRQTIPRRLAGVPVLLVALAAGRAPDDVDVDLPVGRMLTAGGEVPGRGAVHGRPDRPTLRDPEAAGPLRPRAHRGPADQGELLGEHGAYSHSGRLEVELTHIPLLVKWPGQTVGRRLGHLASSVDVFPTVLDAVGLEAPPGDASFYGPPRTWRF